jgi:plastocyanin
MMQALRSRCGAVVLAAATLLGCSGDTGTNGTPNGPSIQATPAIAFTPAVLNVNSGVPVTFVFGSVGHTVVFDAVPGRPQDITAATSNKNVVRTFNTPGDFPYHCTVHSGMAGSVHVTPAPISGAY